MPDLIIIADDLTGALDTGAGFAAAGWKTLAAVDPRDLTGSAQVWVVSTESRHLPSQQAAQRVHGTPAAQPPQAVCSRGAGCVCGCGRQVWWTMQAANAQAAGRGRAGHAPAPNAKQPAEPRPAHP